MKLGDDTDDNIIEDNISAQKPADCAVLVYTVRVIIIMYFISIIT